MCVLVIVLLHHLYFCTWPANTSAGSHGSAILPTNVFKRGKGSHNCHLSFLLTPFLNLLSLHSILFPSLAPPTLAGHLALPNGGCGGWWVGSGPGLPDNCKQLGKLVAPASPSGGLLVYNLIGLHVKTVKAWEKQDASVRWNSNCQPAQNIRTVCLIACNQRGKSNMEGGEWGHIGKNEVVLI